MEFLKELLDLNKAEQPAKKKEKKDTGPHLKMVKLPSFVAGNMVMREGKETVKVAAPKARNKHLNDVLKGRKGGRHYDARADYVRAKEKQKTRNAMMESDDCEDCYFEVSWCEEVKNRSGEGPETRDSWHHEVVKAPTKEAAIAKIKARAKVATDFRAVKTSKPRYDD